MSFAARAHGRTRKTSKPQAPGRPRSAKSAKIGQVGNEEMPDRVRWIRSYVVEEPDGRIGTFCVYQAQDPESIRKHARQA